MSAPTVTIERLNDTAANRNAEVSLKLDHIHATLDLLATVARSDDCGADLQSLCVGTLDGTLDGLMREVAAVQEHIDELPCHAASFLLEAIRALEQTDDPTYTSVRQALEQAHADLDVLDNGRAGPQLTEGGAQP